ncbi:cilia- and flagella-associated protein 206-like [Styela clava]|uniref:cilia- and flagella-associated protein 206-like n=1 Tax=Styela clava TaxID=7725 RepID=UPI0019396EF8|nr:cilia- and flagella-associated protein 206-like [Styela clava]
MSRAQAESVIKNIIREIVQECASKGHSLSETLVAFMVKAVVLDPHNQFNVDRTLTKEDVQKLIKLCVDRLVDLRSPSLDTIKMQVYFDMNYTTRQEFLDEHRRVLEARLAPVTREITDSRARTREELESLYRKIVSYVLLRSGLGSPTDIAVVREATAALQSVFPQTELGTFMSLTKRDKERQLHELTLIVSGIRLFNKECGKGGEGIDDLPGILNEAIPATTQNLDAEIQNSQHSSFRYTTLIEKFQSDSSGGLSEIPSQLLKDALINVRQHETFLRILLNDVIGCAQQVEMLVNQLSTRMDQLQQTVQSKTAVPTAQVYPQFISLSHLWTCFQDEMVLLSVLSNILASIEPFTRTQRELFPDDVLSPHLQNVAIKSDEQRIQETTGQRVNPEDFEDDPKVQWLFPETTKNYNQLLLQYRGYCGFSIVRNDRLLLPGNPDIGILQYQDKLYVFSSNAAAVEFAKNPPTFINGVAEAAKASPELIQLLELHQQFASITPYPQAGEGGKMFEKPVTKSDSGTQTDTHILEHNIVKDYEWNEWELRRKAIKLANLRTKLTKTVQTNLSNLRRDNVSQVYLPKEQGAQTKKESSSNVPKPQVFMAGLRGIRGIRTMVRVDLTKDVNDA